MADRDSSALLDALRIEPEGSPVRRPSRWILWGATVFVLGAAVSFVLFVRTTAAHPPQVPKETPAAVGAASPPMSDGSFQAAGYVVARRKATVAAEVAGRLIDVAVEEGDKVVAGQVLARLNDADAQQRRSISESDLAAEKKALEEDEADNKAAQQNLERIERLHREHLVTDDAIETARQNVARLQAKQEYESLKVAGARNTLTLTESYLRQHTIRAPFAGVVVQRSAQRGEYISPSSAAGAFTRTGLCTIVDPTSIEGEVDVNEVYIHRIAIGQPVTATLNAYPNWQISGRVLAIVPTADRDTATVKVRIRFDQLDDRMLPDMGLRVTFPARAAESSPAPTNRPRP